MDASVPASAGVSCCHNEKKIRMVKHVTVGVEGFACVCALAGSAPTVGVHSSTWMEEEEEEEEKEWHFSKETTVGEKK